MHITADGTTIVLSGDVDVRTTAEVRDAIYDHLRRNEGQSITIDLGDVETIDLTALKVLAVASRFALRRGQRIMLRDACPAVRRMLHLSHLFRFFEVEREPIAV